MVCYFFLMEYFFNQKKIEQTISDFYNTTGIAVAFYDSSGKEIAASPVSGCCSYIKTNQACREHCDLSNRIHMKELLPSRRIYCYTCHAGLMETFFSVMYEDVLIAYLQIGQLRDKEAKYSSAVQLEETAKRHGLHVEKLLSLYDNLPVISQDKLQAVYNIVEILIQSFWVDGLITYNRSMLSVKIERYIIDHLTEKLYIEDIARQFLLSKNALYQLFRNEFHTTVNDFIIQKRLQMAQDLLFSKPELNVMQISQMCGFSDENYFIRRFKNQFGTTPLQFRKTAIKES